MSGLGTERINSPPQASQKLETVELICRPRTLNRTAPSEFRPPPEQPECRRFLTLCVRKSVTRGFSETSKSPQDHQL
jgi:hypothetical protein